MAFQILMGKDVVVVSSYGYNNTAGVGSRPDRRAESFLSLKNRDYPLI